MGGKFIGSDWYSTDYSDYSKGEQAEDIWTRKNFIDGSFNGTGSVHFTDKKHLLELFEQFKIFKLVFCDTSKPYISLLLQSNRVKSMFLDMSKLCS